MSTFLDHIRKAMASATPEPQPVRVWLPDAYGAAVYDAQISKGAGHKYIKRVPVGTTKSGATRYRYYYEVQHGAGVHNEEHFVEGSAFKHDGGHFHVKAVDGDTLTIVHDETGESKKVSRKALVEMLQEHHGKALDAHKAKVAADLAATEKHGSPKQKARMRAHAAKWGVGGKGAKKDGAAPARKDAEKTGKESFTTSYTLSGKDGVAPVKWTAEHYFVGGQWRLDVYRNGVTWAEGIDADELEASLAQDTRTHSKKRYAADRLLTRESQAKAPAPLQPKPEAKGADVDIDKYAKMSDRQRWDRWQDEYESGDSALTPAQRSPEYHRAMLSTMGMPPEWVEKNAATREYSDIANADRRASEKRKADERVQALASTPGHHIESSDRMSNSGYHRSGKPNWWLRRTDKGAGNFVDIPRVRGDEKLDIKVELEPGTYTAGAGRGKDGVRHTFTVPEKVQKSRGFATLIKSFIEARR